MFDFTYYNPTRIVFGKDTVEQIAQLVAPDAKVLITYGGGSAKRSGLIDRVRAALPGREVLEFGGIEPNPQYDTLMKAVDVVREHDIEFMLAVGGGSVIDGTKFISLASHYEGEPQELLTYGLGLITGDVTKRVVPFGTVLTLPATGSEMNSSAVISHDHAKYPVVSNVAFPVFSILDPTLTFTLPKTQVANGVVDAFIHVTEQYLTFPCGAVVQDRLAESILQTLVEIGLVSVAEPENYVARANHEWSATLALMGIVGAGVPADWSTHMIGHTLTALFGIDHAKTLAIVLPSLLSATKAAKRDKLLQYGERVWGLTEGDEDARVDQAILKTREFFESLDVGTHLGDYGVKETDIPRVIEGLRAQGMTALGEHGDLTLDRVEAILLASL